MTSRCCGVNRFSYSSLDDVRAAISEALEQLALEFDTLGDGLVKHLGAGRRIEKRPATLVT